MGQYRWALQIHSCPRHPSTCGHNKLIGSPRWTGMESFLCLWFPSLSENRLPRESPNTDYTKPLTPVHRNSNLDASVCRAPTTSSGWKVASGKRRRMNPVQSEAGEQSIPPDSSSQSAGEKPHQLHKAGIRGLMQKICF